MTPIDSAALRNSVASGGFALGLWVPIVLALVVAGAVVWWLQRGWRPAWMREFVIDEAELGVGSHKIKLRPNYDDLKIAYQLWVELSTRKVGLPIDYDNDVIAEIYESWYDFFGITRDLIKDIPPSKLRSGESIQGLIQLSIDVLNEGLRPHLTRWQARFRRWYESELAKTENLLVEPQDLQKRFPRYDELKEDMDLVNARLMYYREQMRKFVFGDAKNAVKSTKANGNLIGAAAARDGLLKPTPPPKASAHK